MSDYLPQEVVIKILTRLPPKSLLRFRCVSQSWNSLISGKNFISMHTQETILFQPLTAKSDHIILMCSRGGRRDIHSVQIDNKEFPNDRNSKVEYLHCAHTHPNHSIVRYCNGLLCVASNLFAPAECIFLWNPVVKRKINLPVPQATFEYLDPYRFVVGFGFDAENNVYKVVRIAYVPMDCVQPPIVEIYDLNVKNWRCINAELPKNCVVNYTQSQVFIRGNVHWVAYRYTEERGTVDNMILLFNMSLEAFDEIKVPDVVGKMLPLKWHIVDLEGCLAIAEYDQHVSRKNCCIWVMKEYDEVESWSKQYSIHLEEGLTTVLGSRINGDVLFTTIMNELMSYNPVTGVGKTVDVDVIGLKNSFHVGTYSESLALLNDGEAAEEWL